MTLTEDSNEDISTNANDLFLKILILGMSLSILTILCSISACFRPYSCQTCNRVFQGLVFIGNFLYLALVTAIRFSHCGKVCSGDYMHHSAAEVDGKIMHREGHFFIVFICVGWLQLAILLTVLFLMMCFEKGKNSPDKERD